MSQQDKTMEELLTEIRNLRQENASLKAFYESELAKFRSYFELPFVGIAITSPGKGWIEANKGIRDILGYSMEELTALTWAEITHPEDLEADVEQFRRVLSDLQDTYFLEKRFIHKNGDTIWTNLSVGCVRKPDRSVDYMIAVIQDISERKLAERELKRSELELKRAQEITHIGSFTIDLTTNQVTWSEELYKMYGFDPSLPPPLLNESQTLFTVESWNLLSTSIATTVKTGIPYEIELQTIRGDGKNGWMWARGETVSDPDGKIRNLWGAVQDITDRKKAAEEIQQSEQKFRSLYNNMSEGSALHTLIYNDEGVPCDYRIIEVNPAFEEQLGISREKVIDKSSKEAYGVDIPPYFDMYLRVAISGKSEVFETYFAPLEKHFAIKVYCPGEGSFATIFENITDRRNSEQKLKTILTKYQVLFDIFPLAITISDSAGNIIESNHNAESLLGLSIEEQEKRKINAHDWRIIRPDGSGMPPSEFASVRALHEMRTVMNVEMGIVKDNNHVTWLNVSATPIPIEGYGVAIVYGDVTERKQAETESIRTRKLLEDSQRIGKIGGWEFNIDTLELAWTREMYAIHELDTIDKPSIHLRSNFYTPESLLEVDNAVQCAIETGTSYEVDSEIITAKGNRKFVKSIGHADLENRRIFGFFQDITERKLAEIELENKNEQLKELNANKDKFFSIIAHDLKSPFQAILGFSEMLKNEVYNLDIDSIDKYTNTIYLSVQQTFKLLENLLDWAMMQQGNFSFEPKKILINNLIEGELEDAKYRASQKNITLVYATNDDIIITADEKMLTTVVRNLISNALKFTPKDGSISIEVGRTRDHIEVSISDTAVGINAATLEKLFKIETRISTRGTENEKGTGLGLLLCKDFVEKHHGKIWIESEVGKGSRFTFSIPC